MRYIVKNISRDRINILGRIIQPKQEILTFNINPYRKMINEGFLTAEAENVELEVRDKPVIQANEINTQDDAKELNNSSDNSKELNFINIANSSVDKEELLQSLFHFYIDRKLTKEDLDNVKQFYNIIGLTNNLSMKDKELFNKSSNYEELITVLLNNVYPYILD